MLATRAAGVAVMVDTLGGQAMPTVCWGLQDEVEIVHQEGDEGTRHADVEDKIIRQVDRLVEHFNSLFHDEQMDIRCATGEAVLLKLHQLLILVHLHSCKHWCHPVLGPGPRQPSHFGTV